MSEYKGSQQEAGQASEEASFASIVKEERKRLKTLDRQIDRLFWDIEKEEQLGDKNQARINELSKRLRGLLDAYDKIVKRLTDLKEKAPESGDEDPGWKKEIIGLVKWANEEGEKHTLMVRKVNQSYGTKQLLRDLPASSRGSAQDSQKRRQRHHHLDGR